MWKFKYGEYEIEIINWALAGKNSGLKLYVNGELQEIVDSDAKIDSKGRKTVYLIGKLGNGEEIKAVLKSGLWGLKTCSLYVDGKLLFEDRPASKDSVTFHQPK